MQLNSVKKKSVVIIGAGPAGLTAAYELLKQSRNYEVIVLEASDTIGGISRTVNWNGNRMDVGGHRFYTKNARVAKWWLDQLPLQGKPSYDDRVLGRNSVCCQGGPDPETIDDVMLYRKRVSRIYYQGKFFDYPLSLNFNTFSNLGFIQTINIGASYLHAATHQLPEISLENLYINRFGRKLYSMFFEGYTEKVWGKRPCDISADWGKQRIKGVSISELAQNMLLNQHVANKEASLIEEFMYPKYGSGQLWEHVASEVVQLGGQIIFNARVNELQVQNNRIASVQYARRNDSHGNIDTGIVISSMPIKDLISAIVPDVPPEVRRVALGLPYRDYITVGVLIDRFDLKNETSIRTFNNQIPDCWIYVQDGSVKLGRIQVFNNWSPYMVNDVEHTMWLGLEYFCSEEEYFWKKSNEELRSVAAQELLTLGFISRTDAIIDCHVIREKKAYPAYFGTYNEFQTVTDYLNEIENLYCIGRNGQHRYNNMDHSMLTAFEAVRQVLHNSKANERLWNINTEKEYIENDMWKVNETN